MITFLKVISKFYFVSSVEDWCQKIDMDKLFTLLTSFYMLKMKTIKIEKLFWLDLKLKSVS